MFGRPKKKSFSKNLEIKEELIIAKYKIYEKIPHYQVKNTIIKLLKADSK